MNRQRRIEQGRPRRRSRLQQRRCCPPRSTAATTGASDPCRIGAPWGPEHRDPPNRALSRRGRVPDPIAVPRRYGLLETQQCHAAVVREPVGIAPSATSAASESVRGRSPGIVSSRVLSFASRIARLLKPPGVDAVSETLLTNTRPLTSRKVDEALRRRWVKRVQRADHVFSVHPEIEREMVASCPAGMPRVWDFRRAPARGTRRIACVPSPPAAASASASARQAASSTSSLERGLARQLDGFDPTLCRLVRPGETRARPCRPPDHGVCRTARGAEAGPTGCELARGS